MNQAATAGVAGDEDVSNGPSPRFLLNIVSAVVGIPLAWSFLAGMYDVKQYDPLYLAAGHLGLTDFLFWGGLAVGGVLVGFDVVLAKYDEDFKDELYTLLKDIGEHVKGGMALEAAVQKSAGWKKTPPAEAFKRALDLSQSIPFDAALLRAAEETGQRSFREVAGLMAIAVSTGGDVGPSLRWIGGHFATMRQNEKHFTTKIEGSLTMMRGIGLLAAPFLYYHLQRSMDRRNGEQAPLDPMTVAFFVYGAIGMGCLDGIVYDRWARVPAKLPLYIGLVRLSLGFW